MPDAFANALPRKRFFLEMFTRDVSLQDCILDLIDNSIDGLIRSHNVDLGDSFLMPNGGNKKWRRSGKPRDDQGQLLTNLPPSPKLGRKLLNLI